MHALTNLSAALLALASLVPSALAVPGYRRQDNSGLEPWISVNDDGVASTVTPVVTTISGVATTQNPGPTSDGSASATTTGSGAQHTQAGGSSFNVCHNKDGPFAPFCVPTNGTHLEPGSTYYITWDTSAFPGNASVIVLGNYLNASVGGEQAFGSDALSGSRGWYALEVLPKYKQKSKENYIDLFLASATSGKRLPGPRIAIGTAPAEEDFKPTPAPKGPALYIALPTVLAFIILCVGGGFWWNKHARVIGLGNVMGRRKGYGIGKSRGERLGMGRKGAIKLQEREEGAGGGTLNAPTSFRDDTFDFEQDRARRRDSDLGSLVSTPTRPEFGNSAGATGGSNVFRSEMDRQELAIAVQHWYSTIQYHTVPYSTMQNGVLVDAAPSHMGSNGLSTRAPLSLKDGDAASNTEYSPGQAAGGGHSVDSHSQIIVAGASIAILIGIVFVSTFGGKKNPKNDEELSTWSSFLRFFYACFLKPHEKSGENGQQDALESFYKAQAGVYDATRKRLLCGREDMLGLVAAQLKQKATAGHSKNQRRIWVDVGGGTGYNIEAMSKYLSVPEFFSSVYLVDFSPSLCEVARKRFVRLGWNNVKVVCQDARLFRLEDHEAADDEASSDLILGPPAIDEYFADSKSSVGADLVTMSYSLSMIPDYYSVIDSLTNLLAPSGVIGVVDFYVQSVVDLSSRNYTGGALTRHVNWVSRLFWRAWFDIDRVGLDASRRDYLEYRFGTVLSADSRNYLLGAIPYYMWLGCPKMHSSALSPSSHDIIERIDAAVTESPYLHPANYTANLSKAVEKANPEIRSKAYSAALLNLTSNLPLPSFFYQNHHFRIHFDDQLQKHTQFNNEYIYAFTWEDTRVDDRILNLTPSDVVLAITSAGDNILSYALRSPARIHAVDLNPSQNNLLELKVAGYHCLPYSDFWKIFGEGKHANFRELLIEKLSPHLSSRAFQYWL
ncbi:hypothetical protein O988_06138, partial [Pseudogymnoascus sp. VKM F-3808]